MAEQTKMNVLVLCTGNSARSQMAEGFLRKYLPRRFGVYSAGTEPKGLNPLSVKAMAEAGIDIGAHRSKDLEEYLGVVPFYYLIVVCGDAEKKCPAVWPGVHERLFWPFDDPAAATGSEEVRLEAFRRVRDQIGAKCKAWAEQVKSALPSSSRAT